MEIELEFAHDALAGRRSTRRRQSKLPATIISGGDELTAALVDLSETGASVELLTTQPLDDRIVLLVADKRGDGEIIWSKEMTMGARFDDQVCSHFINAIASLSGRK